MILAGVVAMWRVVGPAELLDDLADRMEADRIWRAYCRGVDALVFAQGSKGTAFLARWRALVSARNDAALFDDNAEVRSAEHKLERHTGIPFPKLPGAAWAAADTLPEADREEEYARLRQKYGDRAGIDAPTNGNGEAKGRRRTRPMGPAAAFTTRQIESAGR